MIVMYWRLVRFAIHLPCIRIWGILLAPFWNWPSHDPVTLVFCPAPLGLSSRAGFCRTSCDGCDGSFPRTGLRTPV
jgi:hypothetical protein